MDGPEVDVENAVPFVRVGVEQEARGIDARIVDQNVGRAPAFADLGHEGVDGLGLLQIAGEAEAALGPDLGRQGIQRALVHVGQAQLGASLAETFRQPTSDHAERAGDDDMLAFKFCSEIHDLP